MLRPAFALSRTVARMGPRCSARLISSYPRRPEFVQRIACPAVFGHSIRCYSAPSALSREEVQGRIMDLLKNFDKVTDISKLTPSSHFSNDLGLDSLDTVEVVMAIEEEFSIEIPDKEADAIHTVESAINYIMDQPDAH